MKSLKDLYPINEHTIRRLSKALLNRVGTFEIDDRMIDNVVRKSASTQPSEVMKFKARNSGALRLKFKLNGLTPNCK